MTTLKLGKLPDRNPVKLTVNLMPELHQALGEYAALYAATYGSEEPISELVPAILARFLEGDRDFQRSRHARREA